MAETSKTPENAENVGSDSQAGQNANAEQPEISKDARMWAMFCHLAGLAWLLWWIVPIIGGVIGALIMWQIKKEDVFVDKHGKEAVNFQISMLIYWAIAALLCFACVGVVLAPVVMVLDIVFAIVAAIKASNGEDYRYPLTIRLIK